MCVNLNFFLQDILKYTERANLESTELKVGMVFLSNREQSVVYYELWAHDSYAPVLTVLNFDIFIASSCLQNALDVMRVIPKKANDMMNVGMLEGYNVRVVLDHCMKHNFKMLLFMWARLNVLSHLTPGDF